ncbi:MAG: dockerin type I repeat-containing protein, partial [Bacteroidales bacterium]|nr:dockerin type I repeat-containing protein [Bacteroidales bacterium]
TDGIFSLSFMNGGMDPLTSMEFNVEYGNQTIPYTWSGELATGQAATEQFPITLVAGTESATVVITNANGEAIEPSTYTTTVGSLTCPEWISGVNEDEITINIWQDRYGNQLTWYLYASDSTIIAQGGPYFQLGTNTTKLRTATVTLPEDPDCIQFILYDSGCDGINNGHGEGHLNITKADGTVIWENDGHFGCEVSVNLSINSQIVVAPGDANGDGVINILDIQTIVEYITTAGGTQINLEAADYNGDGAVNILDLQAIVIVIF